MLFLRSLLLIISMITPMNATMGEKFSGLSICRNTLLLSIPDRLRIHAVSVVPMLAPKITLMVWPNSMIPELTRPTSITVVADED